MSDLRICPKCNYQRTKNDDKFVSKNECPGCGIIYDRYIQNKSETNFKEFNEREEIQSNSFSKNTSPKRLKYFYNAIIVLAVLVFIYILLRPEQVQELSNTFSTPIPGTYEGRANDALIEFDVDDHYRISRLIFTTRSGRNKSEIEWHYQESLELKNSKRIPYEESYEEVSIIRKAGKTITITSKPRGNGCNQIALNSSFSKSDIEKDPQEMGLLKPSPNKNAVYTKFNFFIPALGVFQSNSKDVNLPVAIALADLECCGAHRILNNIGMISWQPGDFQCSVTNSYPFVYNIRFKVYPPSSMNIFPGSGFNIVSNSAVIEFPTPYNERIQIVINNNGTGQLKYNKYGHIKSDRLREAGLFFLIKKVGLEHAEEDLVTNEVNWDNCFPGEKIKLSGLHGRKQLKNDKKRHRGMR